MSANYSNVYYFPEECKELDLYRHNIGLIGDEYKKSLAYALMRRAMVRKMPYSRFNLPWGKILQLRDEEFSYEHYRRRRHYHNQSFKFHFLDSITAYNNAVFDNGRNNAALNEDVFDVIDHVDADAIYLDPPYIGTMNNYYGFYGLLDEYIAGHRTSPFRHSFTDRKSAMSVFEELFSRLGKYRYWLLSYNNTAIPIKEQMVSLIRKFARSVRILEKPHPYKVTGKEQKNLNLEYLFIIERK